MRNYLKMLFYISIIKISIFNNVFSGDMGTKKGLDFSNFGGSITGLYFQPNTNFLEYAVNVKPFPVQSGNWFPIQLNTNYKPAFAIDLHYNLDYLKIKLDWLHFYGSYADNTNKKNTSFVGPIFYFGPDQVQATNTYASSDISFKLDHINL